MSGGARSDARSRGRGDCRTAGRAWTYLSGRRGGVRAGPSCARGTPSRSGLSGGWTRRVDLLCGSRLPPRDDWLAGFRSVGCPSRSRFGPAVVSDHRVVGRSVGPSAGRYRLVARRGHPCLRYAGARAGSRCAGFETFRNVVGVQHSAVVDARRDPAVGAQRVPVGDPLSHCYSVPVDAAADAAGRDPQRRRNRWCGVRPRDGLDRDCRFGPAGPRLVGSNSRGESRCRREVLPRRPRRVVGVLDVDSPSFSPVGSCRLVSLGVLARQVKVGTTVEMGIDRGEGATSFFYQPRA